MRKKTPERVSFFVMYAPLGQVMFASRMMYALTGKGCVFLTENDKEAFPSERRF